MAEVVINEVDADQVSTDAAEFIELYDGGAGNTDLSGLALVFYNGADDASYDAFDLDGQSTDGDGYFVLCGNAANVANCDLDVSPDTNLIQNGADAVALYMGDAFDFANDTPLTIAGLLDAIVYDTGDADDAGLLVLLNAGQPQVDEAGGGSSATHSNQRCDNGSGGPRNTDTYLPRTPTPGAANDCPAPTPTFGLCGDPADFIHTIQGGGASSPLLGAEVIIEGVVVGDFQDTPTDLGGFFVQEEDGDVDADPATSEGIFVFDPSGTGVSAGDLVRVQGTVGEFFGLTQLSGITNLAVCSAGNTLPTAALMTLPVGSLSIWETVEGMRVNIAQTLYVTENFDLGRFGEVDLSVGAPLDSPTNVAAPGAPALALRDLNNRSRILLDDGSNVQNPLPLPPYIGAGGTLRTGDTITGLTAVLSFAFGAYRLHPVDSVTFTRANVRSGPPSVGGAVRVASYNVMNYFTTLDGSGSICGPLGNLGCRGADTFAEFTGQRDKLVAAISAMDADVIGLMEIENQAGDIASADLVAGLNDATAAGTYDYIPTGVIGDEAIRVAFLYKPGAVTPIGPFAVLDSMVDPMFDDTKNRPALAQSFEDNASGAKFTAVVNHLKSKGTPCDDVSDPDAGDGQGNCNGVRADAAQALVDWLATDPTGGGSDDFLIIGDLNAYAMEDPITTMKAAGYDNLIENFAGTGYAAGAYSLNLFGESGAVDHAMSSAGLTPHVTGAAIWHINADEPRALDYNDFNQPDLFNDDEFRSSDRDPVLVGLFGDGDGDGVPDVADLCLGTAIPELVPTSGSLGKNRWALIDANQDFDQAAPQAGSKFGFTTEDTGGCSCGQIIDALGLGLNHSRKGCSTSVMQNWVAAH